MFNLLKLSWTEKGELQSPTSDVFPPITSCIPFTFCFMKVDALFFGIWIFRNVKLIFWSITFNHYKVLFFSH